MAIKLCAIVLTLLPALAIGKDLRARVVGVSDGDTVTVLDASNKQYKVRLAGIDAPEKVQPYGQASKQALAKEIFNQQVNIEWSKIDRYGRLVGKIFKEGYDENLAQVRRGMAWHYKAYQREQSSTDRSEYDKAEQVARSEGIGLWQDSSPIPPWEYRRMKKNNKP